MLRRRNGTCSALFPAYLFVQQRRIQVRRYKRNTGMIYMKVHRHLPHSQGNVSLGARKGVCVCVHSHPVCHTTHPYHGGKGVGVMILQQYYFKFLVHSTPPSSFRNVRYLPCTPHTLGSVPYGTVYASITFCLWQCTVVDWHRIDVDLDPIPCFTYVGKPEFF